jgi:uncharacterized membrane protein
MGSIFIGLTLFEEKEYLKNHHLHFIFIFAMLGIVIIVIVLALLSQDPVINNGSGIDLTDDLIDFVIYLFVATIIAVSALMSPGISSFTFLLIRGRYIPLIPAVLAVPQRKNSCTFRYYLYFVSA